MKEFKMDNGNKIEVGETYRFSDLWSGNGDEIELMESGSIWIGNDENDMPIIADFDVIEVNEDDAILSIIKVKDIA